MECCGNADTSVVNKCKYINSKLNMYGDKIAV